MTTETVLSGNLNFMSLADLLQMLGNNGSSGILRLRNRQVATPGLIYFTDGNPVHAICDEQSGLDALYALFGWIEGEFAFSQEPFDTAPTIQRSRMQIILDGLRMLDDGELERIGSESDQGPSRKHSAASSIVRGPMVDYTTVVDEEHFDAGAQIVVEGSYGNWIWVILEGQVDLCRETPKGSLKILRLGEGAFIGGMAAFSIRGHIRNATCVAVTKVVLGVLDLQRLASEYTRMSYEMRRIGLSLDRRIRYLNDRIVQCTMGFYEDEMDLRGFKPIPRQDEKPQEELYLITEGQAAVVREKSEPPFVLARLEAGDVFGFVPFADIGHEPYAAAIWADENLKTTRMDGAALQAEFGRISTTFKNMFENMVVAMSVTTRLVLKACRRNA